MYLVRETFLLFSLNLLDALLTLIWVRNGAASEANALMAKLLENGDFTFLAAKIAIGTFTAIVFIRSGGGKLAKCGMSLALTVYLSLMGVHVVTGLSAFGLITEWSMLEFRLVGEAFSAMFVA